MNLAGWRFVLFAIIGTAAIVLLASIGVPEPDEAPIDNTGQRGVRVRTAADALAEARLTGNARAALAKLRQRLAEFSGTRTLLRLEAVLVAELESEVGPLHAQAGAIEAERKLALRARARGGELHTRARARGSMSPASVVSLLAELEADDRIAASTEAFFAPLARWNRDRDLSADRPDEFAARMLAYLDRAEKFEPEDEELILALIRAFRAQDRPRARIRWALRGFGLFPHSRAIVDALTAAYLEQSRQLEALLVIGAALEARPDDVELWRLRARIAGWKGLHEVELDARRKLLTFADSPDEHRRIIELCSALGRPGDAVPHAEALARDSRDRNELLKPAVLALEAGEIDRALTMLEARAEASDDPAWWRERIIEYAWQDLREDRVVRELRALHASYPDRGYDRRLESVLRRRHRMPELADLLEERLAAGGGDLATEEELLAMRVALGQQDEARALLARQAMRIEDPIEFYRRLGLYAREGIPGLDEAALRMAHSDKLGEASVGEALELLDPLFEQEGFRKAALVIARRFPGIPESRAYLIRSADRMPDDAARAAAIAELARENLDDAELVAAWAERASWAGDIESETKARERLVELRPDDLENRRNLADLYEARNRADLSAAQWRYVAQREGLDSPAQLRLIDALMATGELDEAMALLEKRARLPGASLEDQLHVGDELFGKGHYDRAARFYRAVLEKDEAQPQALLRLGQILAWTNNPRGAIPYLERRLAASPEETESVQFTLGECYWITGDEPRARALHEASLAALQAAPERTITQEVMVAKILARFGRFEEAQPIFERVIAAQPENVDLELDYVDTLLATGKLAAARERVDDVRARKPDFARALRLDGMLALREKRFEVAAERLQETLDRFGPDAGTASELGRARHLAGDFAGARDAYRNAFALQPNNLELADELAMMEDRLVRELHLGAAARRTGDDTFAESWLAGSAPWKGGRTRLGAALGYAHFSGPARVVNNGLTDVETDLFRLDVAATRRFHHRNRVGGGIGFFPGGGGNAPVSLWAGLHLLGTEPYWSVRARGWWNELFDNPAAAAGLGGRSSGGAVDADFSLPGRLWVGGGMRYENLSLDFDGITPSDPRVVASATLGWRAIDGANRVGSPHRIDSALMPGIVGARLPAVLPGEERNALAVWFNAATYRVLGDAELTTIIPLGKRFDYLTLAARYDRHVAESLGFMVEGYVGRELQENKSIFGVSAGLGWRPRRSFELAFTGAYGSALGRAGDEDSLALQLGLTWRW